MSQHSLLKDLLKVLQKEDDVVMVTTALLDLVALLPTVPSNVDKCLHDVFDVFRDIARWRTVCDQHCPLFGPVDHTMGAC